MKGASVCSVTFNLNKTTHSFYRLCFITIKLNTRFVPLTYLLMLFCSFHFVLFPCNLFKQRTNKVTKNSLYNVVCYVCLNLTQWKKRSAVKLNKQTHTVPDFLFVPFISFLFSRFASLHCKRENERKENNEEEGNQEQHYDYEWRE